MLRLPFKSGKRSIFIVDKIKLSNYLTNYLSAVLLR